MHYTPRSVRAGKGEPVRSVALSEARAKGNNAESECVQDAHFECNRRDGGFICTKWLARSS